MRRASSGATLLTLQWVALTDYGILPDDPALIRATLRRAASENDVVISSGGMSAGEEDHVLDALRAEDAALDVLKVAIRPGKPLTVGRIGQALFVGLPGNPYAAAITFAQIARPALRKAAGITEILDLWLLAVAAFSTPMSGILFLPRSGSAKTVQALMIVNALRWQNPAHRTLVIAPNNLMSQWQEECWIRGDVMPALAGPIAGSDDDTASVTLSRPRDLMIRPGQGMRTITADPLVVPALGGSVKRRQIPVAIQPNLRPLP